MCTFFILCKCNMHVQFLHRVENAAVQEEWHPTNPIFVMREFDSFPSLLFPLPSSPNDAMLCTMMGKPNMIKNAHTRIE